MVRDEHEPTVPATPGSGRPPGRRLARWAGRLLLALGGTAAAAFLVTHLFPGSQPTPPAKARPKLFQSWPVNRKPELAVVLTGERQGYLKFCGCSPIQLGGLERLYNLLDHLRAERGWPVVPVDLGNIPIHKGLHDQEVLKYDVTMQAYEKMGYAAVGIGLNEFEMPLAWDLLSTYPLNQKQRQPRLLGATLVLKNKNGQFIYPAPAGDPRDSLIGSAEVVTGPNHPAVGIVGLIPKNTVLRAMKADPKLEFRDNRVAYTEALTELRNHPAKPQILIMLFQGTVAEAKLIAKDFQPFQAILCTSETEEAPSIPEVVKHTPPGALPSQTLIMSVGHRGRYAGVLGLFRNTAGGLDPFYEMVALDPDWETPAGEEGNHPIVKLLQDGYAKQVQQRQFLTQVVPTSHPAQLKNPQLNLTYIGTNRCATCHANETAKWQTTKHSHAFDSLVKIAAKPSLRQFDPECVRCHTVGFDYNTGFTDEPRTPHLKDVGCESCHGPGSAHAAAPKNPAFYPDLSPWKKNPTDRLPGLALLQQGSGYSDAARAVLNAVDQKTCQKCHDQDNDPNYRFEKYWPQIYHTGLNAAAPGGGANPGGAAGAVGNAGVPPNPGK